MTRRLIGFVVLVAVLAGCSWPCAEAEEQPIVRRGPGVEAPAAPSLAAAVLARWSTEEQLQKVVPPLRDLRELAVRLDPALESVPATVHQVTPTFAIGDQESFWVHDTSTNSNVELTAQLVYSTPVAYVWVEAGQPFNKDAIEKSIDRFSSRTYPKEVNAFGSEWHPGVDNDPRLHILYNTAMGSGVAGYFYSADEYSRLASPTSNQKEMFYINLTPLNQTQNYAFHETTLAHELQHMIHWYQDRGEDLWINEGLSEYAQQVAGFEADMLFAHGFAQAPDLQLTTWGAEPGSNGPHYGSALLFVTYLAQRFGQPLLTALVAAPENGMAGVDAALAEIGAPVTAAQVFADWVVANYARQAEALGTKGVYGYQGVDVPEFVATARHEQFPVASQSGQVFNHATDYVELLGEGDVTFAFAGQPETRLAEAEVQAEQPVWWSNRGDDANPRLTHQFDLSAVAPGTPVTLTATMWWEIEADYDYGYVMASRDGEHWEILPGQRTTTIDRSGNLLGAGYTSRSVREAADLVEGAPEPAPEWVTEQYDLRAYAGGPVSIQFSYVTDDAVNQAGWMVKDVQVTDGAGPLDDAVTDMADGWQSEGWLLTDNRLAQPWLVQVMEFDGDRLTQVRRVPVDARGHGEIDIDGLGKGRRAVVAISGLAPVTTVPGDYKYSVGQR